ncbi:MAG: tetraacyldisaccharide 4'-kinase [Desulfuromonas sp.]|nr:tetraacyldisaccharide 4'-kinase [Desulfuromonas sp.]
MEHFSHAYRRMIDARPSNVVSWTFFVLLWPLSLLYRVVTSLRAALYRTSLLAVYRAGVPVISIGNLTVGGTGKTPVADALVKRLLDRGLRVALVSRGYGGRFSGTVGCVAKGDGQLLLSPRDAGDEPCLLAARNPSLQVYVARKRALGVQAAERAGAQVIVLDDGFQHLAVHRDVDIVLLDARAPFGNGQLLPAGPLRETRGALRRASVVIMTHAVQPCREVPFRGPVLHCRHRLADALMTIDGREMPWSLLAGEKILAFAGIARPDDFFAALRARGVVPAATLALNDHQDYSGERLNRLIQSCDNIKFAITTEKDAVKLRTVVLPCPCLVVPLVLAFEESERFDDILGPVLERIR